MDEKRQTIYMQVRLARLASERWGLSLKETAELFGRYKVFDYIEELYGLFHVQGDETNLVELEGYMKDKGAFTGGCAA